MNPTLTCGYIGHRSGPGACWTWREEISVAQCFSELSDLGIPHDDAGIISAHWLTAAQGLDAIGLKLPSRKVLQSSAAELQQPRISEVGASIRTRNQISETRNTDNTGVSFMGGFDGFAG
jgi:hypothetical protein